MGGGAINLPSLGMRAYRGPFVRRRVRAVGSEAVDMRLLALTGSAVLLLSLSGCALPASEKELSNAAQATLSCLIHAAENLDDQKSDATAVAYGILGACDSEIRQSEAITAQGLNFEGHQTVRRRLNEYFLKTATEVVLKERSLHAQSMKGSQPPVSVNGSLQDAIDAYSRGDYATALRIFHSFANQGNALAQGFLGLMYDEGKGVAQNHAEAVKWTRKAADQGNVTAQTNLGFHYSVGLGVTQDYGEAARWYRKASDQGDASAKKELDALYARFPSLREPR